MKTKTFLITGANSGFGKAFALAALEASHTVIGTVRNEQDRLAFDTIKPGHSHAIILDVTKFDAIQPIVAEALLKYGPVDVLINNAGYGHEGILEESSIEELQKQFAVNVFGAVAMTKAVLPSMRERRNGNIINITSMGGYITMPGIAYYCGSKYALEGISETLAKEVSAFGIKVTAIAPGSFRTDWAGRSMVRTERNIADYDAIFDPIRKARIEKSGKQNGDPVKAAKVVLDLVEMENPPVHLILGSDALGLIRGKLTSLASELDRWEHLSTSTDIVTQTSVSPTR